ncbi:hypothetical protein ALC60_06145 [Trachymyrmex zeteki]|uniref:Uncharacterized protein n=1 Tax=Mycetomoellerius zeteki TaxID=64791 RepID=A0A151X3Y4_9HYME|nr:hypothetical protein ALC60_06145 [Trachymyrmex zeteki]
MKRSQCVIRAVLLLIVIQLHCEIVLAAQSPITQRKHKKHSDDIISSENTDSVLPVVPPYIIDASRHKPQPPSKLHRHQVHLDDAVNLDSSELYTDPIPYIIDVPRRKPSLLLSKLRKHEAYLDNAAAYLDNVKRAIYNQLYVIAFLFHKPQSEWKPSSDVSEEHLHDASDKYSDEVQEEHMTTVPDSDEIVFSSNYVEPAHSSRKCIIC